MMARDLIHHHAAMPRWGTDGDAFDVIETDEITIYQGAMPIESGFDTVAEAEARADELANEWDADDLRNRTSARDGSTFIRADKVKEGDALDFEGDKFADPLRHADPDAPAIDGEHVAMEFEFARVEAVEREGTTVVLYTDQGTYGFPPDHEIEIGLDATLAD